MNIYKKFGLSLLVVGLVLIGGFSALVPKAQAATNITVTSAKITGAHQLTIVFNTGGQNLVAAPITAYGPADNGINALTLASDAGVDPRTLVDITSYPSATYTAVYTFDGAAATVNDTGSITLHNPTVVTDAGGDSFTGITVVPVTDGQAPTLAASNIFINNSVQPNKIILTFSEPLASGPAQTVGNYMVTNGTITYTIATAVLSPSNTVTLTLATVNPADNKTFITNDDFLNAKISVTPNAGITDTATPANPYAGGLVNATVYGTYDGTSGTVTAALTRTNATTYKVTFSEKLDLTTSQTLNKYTLSGTCLASTGNPSAAVLQTNGVDVVLTIPDTSGCSGGQTVIVTPANTITDVAGWPITSSAATKILATTAIITVSSAKITRPNQITIVFVPGTGTMSAAPATAFGAGALALTADGARSITSLDSLIGNTAVYTFNGAAVALNETAILTFTTPTYITDTGNNTYNGSGYSPFTISDGQAPTYTAVVTSPTSITLTFSENVTTLGGDTDGDGWAISGTDANGVSVTDNTNPGGAGNTMVLSLNGTLSGGTHPVVNVDYTQASGTTVDNGNNQVANLSSVAATESIPPTVSYIHTVGSVTTSATSVDFSVKFSEPATDVHTADFITDGTVSSSSITGVAATGDPSIYTVSVNTGTGNGTLWLDVVGGMGVMDLNGNVLTDNTSTSEIYTINKSSGGSTGSSGSTPRAINSLAFAGECKLGDLFSVVTGRLCPVSSVPSITSSPIQTSCSIYGSTNESVKEKTRGINAKGVQNAINQLKATTLLLSIDGIIGPLSEAGIKNVQKIILVTPDGIWGPKTQQAYVLFIKKQCPAV